ncbi:MULTISPECIES: hypothetical protein [Protofrankia]|uniref:AttH domain-containing protein n=1 Tax=Candidatus Protofrankia datiscae TaxID=2716812 RepID=F8B0X9_9ACTN|nr:MULTISPECIES: hypothetical protein [Protofrankia]AEH07609.1 hypothetical protein FsymDg_0017 [Candidatus Protofrankia datiscae]
MSTPTATSATTGTATVSSRGVPAEWLPRPEDELLHKPFGDESLPWKETFFITVRDDALNANINMHMTVSANRSPNTRCAIGVAQGNKSVIQVLRTDGTHNDRQVGNELARLEMVNLSWDSNHELRWVGSLDEVEFDLTLKGKHFAPLWDTMFRGYYATGESGQVYCHTEQVVTANGTMRWRGGPELAFSGFGWRDRGWGRRKTQLMWNTGWDLLSAILPDDSVFSVIALRSHELPEPAPMPVAGWWSDAHTLVPCVGGVYHKEATACPKHYELEFSNGHRIAGDLVRPTGRVAVAMQEAEVGPEAPNWAATMQDYYAIFVDPEGREFPLFTQNGYIHKVDVFRGTQFVHAGSPPRRA